MSEKSGTISKPGAPKTICALLVILLLLLSPAASYGSMNDKESKRLPTDRPEALTAEKVTPEMARSYIISEKFEMAVSNYAILLQKDSADITLNAEYAYALALNGIYDAALSRLDRIWMPGSGNQDVGFFASQVFALMGYATLADDIRKKGDTEDGPAWISSKAPELINKYKDQVPGGDLADDDVVTTFKRANRLTAQNHHLMSIALFEDIVSDYPGEYLPYVGYSIALEKAGMYEKSAQTVELALGIVGDNPERQEAKQFLEQRLTDVRGMTGSEGKNSTVSLLPDLNTGSKGRRMQAYAGGMIASSYLSITGRLGTFISDAGSLSLDAGITSSSGSTSINLGVSAYQRKNVFVAGFGLNSGFGGGSTTLYFKLSVGLSFMNDEKSASWDIFLDGQQPISPKGDATIVGMSIGRSVYFGNR